MNNLIVENDKIENMIYEIKGKQVMLDSDLAKLYQCKNGTKEINQAVKNNIKKFPERYSWKLTLEEEKYLRSKILTSSSKINSYGGRRYFTRVFTEQGVAMLATILKTPVAVEVSIGIMDAFVKMRKYISDELINNNVVNSKLLEHDNRIKVLEETFSKFKENTNEIFFDGQIYDAYSKIIDILKQAKKELIIIDSYADKTVLDIISKIKVKVTLICKTKTLLSKSDIEKYNKQYNNLNIIYDDTYHDRYFILDKKEIYHSGTSLNHIGEKTFSINKIEDEFVIENFINKLKEVLN